MNETTRPAEIAETDFDQVSGGGESDYKYVPVRRFFTSASTSKNTGASVPDGSPNGFTATDDLWK